MTIGRSGWIVFAVFLIGFALLMEVKNSADLVVRAAIWAAILLASGYELVSLWRGKGHSTDPTVGLTAGLRRWLVGDSAKR